MATTFDPFREMDRLFGEGFRTAGPGPMPMDLYKRGETFTAEIDLPSTGLQRVGGGRHQVTGQVAGPAHLS